MIGAFFYSSFLYSQTPGLGTWNVLTGRFNYNSKWHGFVELQLRSQQTYDHFNYHEVKGGIGYMICLLYTSPSPRDRQKSRMPSSA